MLATMVVSSGAVAPDSATAGPTRVARVWDTPGRVDSVLAISIDGLNPAALRRLGRTGTPHIHELMRTGASTLNARTEHELTLTLPNHTGMVTGRRVAARY